MRRHKEYKQPIIVNSDAHVDQLVGRHEDAYRLLDEMDFPKELVVDSNVDKLKGVLHKFK